MADVNKLLVEQDHLFDNDPRKLSASTPAQKFRCAIRFRMSMEGRIRAVDLATTRIVSAGEKGEFDIADENTVALAGLKISAEREQRKIERQKTEAKQFKSARIWQQEADIWHQRVREKWKGLPQAEEKRWERERKRVEEAEKRRRQDEKKRILHDKVRRRLEDIERRIHAINQRQNIIYRDYRLNNEETLILYHQTNQVAAKEIKRTGRMLRGRSGLAGGAIYFATSKSGTKNKARSKGYMIIARVRLGRVKSIRPAGDRTLTFRSLLQEGYDSVKISRGSGDEYAVYNYDQVEVLEVKKRRRNSKW